ncbi:MAG TPA: glucokinase [Vicinamibacterales bacterium]|nr:glucokinase [Vicinamibacterales bacterium]
MLLAGDVGGTKTLLGLFSRTPTRPSAVEVRSYRTLDFTDLGALCLRFLRETSTTPADVEAASFGVAGPVTGTRAQLTNVPWVVDVDALRTEMPVGRAYLLNDLEALAWSVPVLTSDEIEVLHEGRPDADGNAALIAAGTGLGIALLPNVDGRLVPRASEGGHVDFAPRNAEEQALAAALSREYGRVDVERVVSGPGLANIHTILYPHQCASLTPMPAPDDLPPAISRAALDGSCASCTRTLEVFVSAYGASAGNLALTMLSTGGVYLGGGIAPRILPALRWPIFMRSFLEKSPMDALISRMPVRVILNPEAGLLGAASYANGMFSRQSLVDSR